MKKNLHLIATGALAAAAALALSSCADPYYTSYGASYGYGAGYGYGGTGFSSATFISTGNPRWAYDPYSRAYYDFSRRAYYDPYLYGYYPIGYRPVVVQAAPHPYGWRPGRTRIAPPARVTNVTLRNYDDRHGAYRRSGQTWARQVEQGPVYDTRRSAYAESTTRRVTAPRPEDRNRPIWAGTRAPSVEPQPRRDTWRARGGRRAP
jgi:hypothetical protein